MRIRGRKDILLVTDSLSRPLQRIASNIIITLGEVAYHISNYDLAMNDTHRKKLAKKLTNTTSGFLTALSTDLKIINTTYRPDYTPAMKIKQALMTTFKFANKCAVACNSRARFESTFPAGKNALSSRRAMLNELKKTVDQVAQLLVGAQLFGSYGAHVKHWTKHLVDHTNVAYGRRDIK